MIGYIIAGIIGIIVGALIITFVKGTHDANVADDYCTEDEAQVKYLEEWNKKHRKNKEKST